MKKHLMVLGDVRVGDCFHIGTFLNRIKDIYETTWIHGQYERNAVKFLRDFCNLNIVRTIERPSLCFARNDIPYNQQSILDFIGAQQYNSNDYDLITKDFGPLYFAPGDPVVFETKNLPENGIIGDYMVVHTNSVSNWKKVDVLMNLNPIMPVYSVGLQNEIFPKYSYKDYVNKPLEQVASLMMGAKCVIGIHSSMACLAFHLGVPLVVCDFWDGEHDGLRFDEYRDNCIQIRVPTVEKVLDATRTFGGY